MNKKEILQLKDSAAVAWNVKPQLLTISVLQSGVMEILNSLAKMKLISIEADFGNEPNAETKKIIEETNAGKGSVKFKNVKSFIADLRK